SGEEDHELLDRVALNARPALEHRVARHRGRRHAVEAARVTREPHEHHVFDQRERRDDGHPLHTTPWRFPKAFPERPPAHNMTGSPVTTTLAGPCARADTPEMGRESASLGPARPRASG